MGLLVHGKAMYRKSIRAHSLVLMAGLGLNVSITCKRSNEILNWPDVEICLHIALSGHYGCSNTVIASC